MTTETTHEPTAIRPAGKKFRAHCSCGWVSTPRTSERTALDAIECEHGYSESWRRDGDVEWNTSAKIASLTAVTS